VTVAEHRSKRAQSAERTREQLLRAGLELLEARPTEDLFEVLTSKRIAAAAGRSTSTFYDHFTTPASYVEGLLRYTLGSSDNPHFDAGQRRFSDELAAGATFGEALVRSGIDTIQQQDAGHSIALQMALWAKASRDPEAAAHLAAMYERVAQTMASFFDQVLDATGRTVRVPFTTTDLARLFLALFEGVSLQRRVDPPALPDEWFGYLLASAISLMTTGPGEPDDADSWLAEFSRTWNLNGSPPLRS
jgi:AcrR family transcriptional regulator